MKKELPYTVRLKLFEREKKALYTRDLSAAEYEAEVRRLADKYRI